MGLQPRPYFLGRDRLTEARLAFKHFVKLAHQHGIAVILDVVYNHLGPSDLDLWQFDGGRENNRGGIYFYNDYRAKTPWGETQARLRTRARSVNLSSTTP